MHSRRPRGDSGLYACPFWRRSTPSLESSVSTGSGEGQASFREPGFKSSGATSVGHSKSRRHRLPTNKETKVHLVKPKTRPSATDCFRGDHSSPVIVLGPVEAQMIL
jgi:hypothetical protein